MSASKVITGSCNCGQIILSLPHSALPDTVSLCHCTSCRASGGTLFSVNLVVKKTNITVTGTPKTYSAVADSGQYIHRNFCGDCGSPVFSTVDSAADLAFVKGGLFVKSGITLPPPGQHVYWKRAEPWENKDNGVNVFEEDAV